MAIEYSSIWQRNRMFRTRPCPCQDIKLRCPFHLQNPVLNRPEKLIYEEGDGLTLLDLIHFVTS